MLLAEMIVLLFPPIKIIFFYEELKNVTVSLKSRSFEKPAKRQ